VLDKLLSILEALATIFAIFVVVGLHATIARAQEMAINETLADHKPNLSAAQ